MSILYFFLDMLQTFIRLIIGIWRHFKCLFIKYSSIKIGNYIIKVPSSIAKQFNDELYSILTFAKLSNFKVKINNRPYVIPSFVNVFICSKNINSYVIVFKMKFFSRRVDSICVKRAEDIDKYGFAVGYNSRNDSSKEIVRMLGIFKTMVLRME